MRARTVPAKLMSLDSAMFAKTLAGRNQRLLLLVCTECGVDDVYFLSQDALVWGMVGAAPPKPYEELRAP